METRLELRGHLPRILEKKREETPMCWTLPLVGFCNQVRAPGGDTPRPQGGVPRTRRRPCKGQEQKVYRQDIPRKGKKRDPRKINVKRELGTSC